MKLDVLNLTRQSSDDEEFQMAPMIDIPRAPAVRAARPEAGESGSLEPVIDRVLPLEEGRAAHAYLETKRARGKIVLEVTRE